MSLLNNSENRRNVIFYFQVHQPRRLRPMRFFDIGSGHSYFNDSLNRDIVQRVAKSCYLPANALLLKVIQKNPNVRINFSISGVALEQFEEFAPEVIESFRALAETGSVEFLGETYYHSLACLIPGHEFEIQILKHAELVEKLFGKRPRVFRNTELIYSDEIGRRVAALDFRGIFTDGVQKILGNSKSVNQVYHHPEDPSLKILLRNYLLSDDIAFRFNHHHAPLTAETYVSWLSDIPAFERIVNIAMDYETFGEHQKKETGIFSFLKKLLSTLARSSSHRMMSATEAVDMLESAGKLSVPQHVSWADHERDLSAWIGNDMQKDALASLLKLDKPVKAAANAQMLKLWRSLQTSDHFYYMSTKRGTDGAVHDYFSPFPSPYEAFINYMNVLTDFTLHVKHSKALPRRGSMHSQTPATEILGV
ncbi:MAG TPA: glycoside hydrolase family 57 protein [Chryseosolibacter sp.]|nr:glycoside hydrolase family 57 protein [Chryseosolibacter sp.]